MRFLPIEKALKKKRGKVNLRGWIYRERKLKDKIFLVIRDSSDIVQCVVKKEKVSKKVWEDANKLLIESSVEVSGDLYRDKRAPTGYEVNVKGLNVIHFAEKFPITKDQSTEFLLDKRHLWIRSKKMVSILKIRSTVFSAIHEYFRKNDFHEFHSPSLTPGVAEEGPILFEVNYFGKKMYLTQTWQLYAEAAIFALEKIYTIAPSFRAEKSKTSRHLTEYWHAEVEAAWIDLNDLMDIGEGLIKHVVNKVLKENKKDLEVLSRDVKKLKPIVTKKFPRITYTKALDLLKKKKKIDIPWGKDLRTVEEDMLSELYDVPIFVTHYPKEIMAFYKPRDPSNPKVALCFDTIAPEGYGELIGGSERDINIKELEKALRKSGENIKNYGWYLELRKYGSVPHAGFGMGVERLVAWICGLDNIKDAIGFPRTMFRHSP